MGGRSRKAAGKTVAAKKGCESETELNHREFVRERMEAEQKELWGEWFATELGYKVLLFSRGDDGRPGEAVAELRSWRLRQAKLAAHCHNALPGLLSAALAVINGEDGGVEFLKDEFQKAVRLPEGCGKIPEVKPGAPRGAPGEVTA
jgi:hypothetical protein